MLRTAEPDEQHAPVLLRLQGLYIRFCSWVLSAYDEHTHAHDGWIDGHLMSILRVVFKSFSRALYVIPERALIISDPNYIDPFASH